MKIPFRNEFERGFWLVSYTAVVELQKGLLIEKIELRKRENKYKEELDSILVKRLM